MVPLRFLRPLHILWSLVLLVGLALPAAPVPAAAVPDMDAELKVMRTAYGIITRSYYREPDTAALLSNAQAEAARQLRVVVPLDLLPMERDAQFDAFAANVRRMMEASGAAPLAKGDLSHAVVRDMAKTLDDKHTYFLDEAAADAQRRRSMGDTSVVNFGILATNGDREYVVKNVIDGSPVQMAGLLPGDVILRVDDQPLNWENRMGVLGSPRDGRVYEFRVRRSRIGGEVTLQIPMKRYTRQTLTHRVLDGHIGYIRTFAFFNDIPQQLDKALTDLHAQGIDSLIVDFRGNGGGVGVERVTGRFVANGTEIGRSEGRTGRGVFVANAERRPRETLPVVVLMDETSGSASEIAALALREFNGVTLVGATSSGAIGTTRPTELGDGTMLAITLSEYVSHGGERLNGVGVSPDIAVNRTADDIVHNVDPQLDAAIAQVAAQLPQRTQPPVSLPAPARTPRAA